MSVMLDRLIALVGKKYEARVVDPVDIARSFVKELRHPTDAMIAAARNAESPAEIWRAMCNEILNGQ
jgi:hypothetical protein